MSRLIAVITGAVMALAFPVLALATATTTRGYHANTAVNAGTIVSLTDNATVVTPATKTTAGSMVGIVAGPDGAVFATTEESDDVQVATEGVVNVIVSDVAGSIKSGDPIGVDSLTGIGVKMAKGYSVGTAEGSFDAKSNNAQKVTLKTSSGKTVTVAVGVIPVLVQPNTTSGGGQESANTATAPKNNATNAIGSFISDTASGFAGKKVSPVIAILGLVIVCGTALVAMAVVASAVRATVISIGRNPLAKRSIVQSTIQAVILGVVILMLGMAAGFGAIRFL